MLTAADIISHYFYGFFASALIAILVGVYAALKHSLSASADFDDL